MVPSKGPQVRDNAHKERHRDVYVRVWETAGLVMLFAAVTAAGELAVPLAKEMILREMIYVRSHEIWAPLLVNGVIMGGVGLLLLPAVLHLSRPTATRIACAVLGAVGCLCLLHLDTPRVLSRIHFVAKAILATGVGIAVQGLLVRQLHRREHLARHAGIVSVLLVAAAALGTGGWHHVTETRILTGLSDPPASASNVLLIVLDTVRAENMSLYGYERRTTPHLERFAGEGAVFRRAIATAPWTLPSHASLFTGRFPHETRAGWTTALDGVHPTLAEVLSSHGYVTGGFVANPWYCQIEYGLARGFAHYEDYAVSVGEVAARASLVRHVLGRADVQRFLGYHELPGRKPAARITNDFLRWLNDLPDGRPFFAFLNYFDAHHPYLPPEEFAKRFGPTDGQSSFQVRYREGPCTVDNTTAEETEAIRNGYDAAIACLDDDLNRLLTELNRRHLLDSTLVIMVSDHGEEFGEHGLFGHGETVYIQSLLVPLIMRLPSHIPAGAVIDRPVSLRDVPATIMELLDLPARGRFAGRSLSRHWRNDGTTPPSEDEPMLSQLVPAPWRRDRASAAKGEMKSIIMGDMHYIHNANGSEEIYDLRHDPSEQEDLSSTPLGRDFAAKARQTMQQMLR